MKFSKITLILLFLIKLNSTFGSSRFLKIELCDTSNVTTIIHRCNIVDDKLNFVWDVIKPINQAQIDIAFFRKFPAGFKQTLKIPTIEICTLLQDISKNQSPLIKSFLKIFKTIAEDAVKPCPYSGIVSLLNVAADSKMLSWVPKGTIKAVVKAHNKDDKNIMRITAVILFEK